MSSGIQNAPLGGVGAGSESVGVIAGEIDKVVVDCNNFWGLAIVGERSEFAPLFFVFHDS